MIEKSEIDYLNHYELKLTEFLLEYCNNTKRGSKNLFTCDDIHNKWVKISAEYMVDALPNFNKYPKAAIAWAGYLGTAIANLWDSDWSKVGDDIYQKIRSARGFDEMDEYIKEEILGAQPGSEDEQRLDSLMLELAELALDRIYREEFEAQSVMAFHVFARTVKALYAIAASCELYRLGYKYQEL